MMFLILVSEIRFSVFKITLRNSDAVFENPVLSDAKTTPSKWVENLLSKPLAKISLSNLVEIDGAYPPSLLLYYSPILE